MSEANNLLPSCQVNPRLMEELLELDARAKKRKCEIEEQFLLLCQHYAAERERLSKSMADSVAAHARATELYSEAEHTLKWLATLEPYKR